MRNLVKKDIFASKRTVIACNVTHTNESTSLIVTLSLVSRLTVEISGLYARFFGETSMVYIEGMQLFLTR